jgi:hypothetical protein
MRDLYLRSLFPRPGLHYLPFILLSNVTEWDFISMGTAKTGKGGFIESQKANMGPISILTGLRKLSDRKG